VDPYNYLVRWDAPFFPDKLYLGRVERKKIKQLSVGDASREFIQSITVRDLISIRKIDHQQPPYCGIRNQRDPCHKKAIGVKVGKLKESV
jgi:hypothetical protein